MPTPTSIALACDALGDPRRVAILARLARGPATFADLAGEFGGPADRVRYHLCRLRKVGVVTHRKRVGRDPEYDLDRGRLAALTGDLAALGGGGGA